MSGKSYRAEKPLSGEFKLAGDKSISHRAILLGALSIGETKISGLLEGEDVLATATACQALGAEITHDKTHWKIHGRGTEGFRSPTEPLDFGNSGTGIRLAMGAIAGSSIEAHCTGDASLQNRPMGRVIKPLAQMGAQIEARDNEYLPLHIKQGAGLIGIEHRQQIASAQVKSAVLLAGLGAKGTTRVIEPIASRDHTEKMLKLFGADITTEPYEQGSTITLQGKAELIGQSIEIPKDPSSAAFGAVAACMVEASHIRMKNIMCNPARDGLWKVLEMMGAEIKKQDAGTASGEKMAHFEIRHKPLNGIDVPKELVPSMIDEFPILAMAASIAEGETHFRGWEELRVKESDRLASIAAGLKANGVPFKEYEDGMTIIGQGGQVKGGGFVKTNLDHRIAMSFAILGLAAKTPIEIDSLAPIATSFPRFCESLTAIGGRIEQGA